MDATLFPLASTLLSIAFGILFVYVTWYSAWAWGRWRLLKVHGQHAQGKIVERRNDLSPTARYFVAFRFPIQNSAHHKEFYTSEQQVSWRHVERLKSGDLVEVLYLPHDPKIAELTGNDVDNTSRDTVTIVAVLAIVIMFPYCLILWIATFLIEQISYWYRMAGKR